MFNKLWGVRRAGQSNNIVFRVNINGIWKRIRGIPGFFLEGTIINGNGREVQSWDTTINLKGVIEVVINCHIVVLSH